MLILTGEMFTLTMKHLGKPHNLTPVQWYILCLKYMISKQTQGEAIQIHTKYICCSVDLTIILLIVSKCVRLQSLLPVTEQLARR